MFSFFTKFFAKETDTMTFGKIEKIGNRYGIIQKGGDVLGTYSRRRDAVRGAARQGITLY